MRSLRKVISLCLLYSSMLFLMTACFQWRASNKQVQKYFREAAYQPKVKYEQFEEASLRYLTISTDSSLPTVVFVHGAPGSSKTYFSFLSDSALAQEIQMVAIDRLGYGYSDFGHSETSLERQAFSLAGILRKHQSDEPLILVGHSFGGPVVARVASDFPELVDGLVFLAPAIDPEIEKFFWFSPLGKIPPARWLTPAALRVAADEKYTHIAELEALLPGWEKIEATTTYIHGDADNIVPYDNTAFVQRKLVNAPLKIVTIPGMNHYLPTHRTELVTIEILDLLKRIKGN